MKETAKQQLILLQKEMDKLTNIINEPEKLTAKDWLIDYLSKPFDVELSKGFIIYYSDGKWVFQQDLKNGRLWVCYSQVWQFFENEYGMNYEQIQALVKEVVGEALNCKELTPDPLG